MAVSKLSAGGPDDPTGGVRMGPLTAALPTDATTAYAAEWIALGLVGNDGVTPGGERSLEDVLDWNGDVVMNLQSQHSVSFSFGLMEVLNTDVQKAVYGDQNVTETAATTTSGKLISVTETGDPLEHRRFGIDLKYLKNKTRLVLPYAKITTIEEAAYTVGAPRMFTATVSAYKDENGVKVYRYLDDGTFSTV